MPDYRLLYNDKPHEFVSLWEAQQFVDGLPSRAGIEIVEAPMLFRHLNAVGAPLTNWREIIGEINNEWGRAQSSEYRVALLATFKATMDIAETTVAPEDLQKFRDTRRTHYNSFIVREALVGANVCAETLDLVTRREVEAGRMSPEDNLRKGAADAVAAPHLSRAELEAIARAQPTKAPSLWARLCKIFRG